MPRQQLQALTADVDRLLVAGGTVAAGDEGLQKRAKALRELGKQVPALTQIADAVERVTTAPPKQVTPALLELLLLTRQVRASLMMTGPEGTVATAEAAGPWETAISSRDLYPLVETLTHSGQGRIEVVKDALERQLLNDLRLVDPLQEGLADGFDELAELVATKAIPAFGLTILPELQRQLNLNGKRKDARRLLAICKLDPKVGGQLSRKALTDGSPEVRIQALKCLAELHPAEAETAALAQLSQKPSRDLRCAAFECLALSKKDEALEALLDALLGNPDYQVWWAAQTSLKQLPHPRTTARLVERIQESAAEITTLRTMKAKKTPAPAKGRTKTVAGKSKESLLESARERVNQLAQVIGGRKDPAAAPALIALLEHTDLNVREHALQALSEVEDPKGLEVAAGLIDDPKLWEEAIDAAWKLPSKLRFEKLAPLCATLSQPKKSQRERGEHLLEWFDHEAQLTFKDDWVKDEYGDEPETAPAKPRTDWDPRWVKALTPHLDGPSRPGVAIALELIQGKKIIPELVKRLVPSVKKNECGVVEALGRLRVREAIPTLVELMPGQAWHHYCIHDALRRIGDPSAIPLLEKVVNKTKDAYRKQQIEEVIAYLEKKKAKK